MKSIYQQEFEDILNQWYEYTIWIGTNRWALSKIQSSGWYFLGNGIEQLTFETLDEAVFYLLLEETNKHCSAKWVQ